MADNEQTKPIEEDEKKIPVFTVLKNNAILKNIFLLDNPPSISILSIGKVDKSDQETEEILTVGRHPDCTIMLTHPSISRFHLRIHSEPSSQKLSVIDLSSVHGTWVSDRKIEPGVRVEMKEGDTVRMGGSSRVYKLYWVPLGRAYDLDNLFLSPSDLLMMKEKEEENVNLEGDNVDDTCEDYDSLSVKNKEVQLLDSISDVVEYIFSDENLDYFVKREVPSAPPMPEELNTHFSDVENILNQSPLEEGHKQKKNLSPCFEPSVIEAENFPLPVEAEAQPLVVAEVLSEREYPESPKISFERNATEAVNFSVPIEGFLFDADCQKIDNEAEVLSERETPESPKISLELQSIFPDELNSPSLDEQEENRLVAEVLGQVINQTPVKGDHGDKDWSGTLDTETMNLSLPSRSILLEIENQKFEGESQTPTSLDAADELSGREISESSPIRSVQRLKLPSIWSRRGKPASVLQIQTGRNKGKNTEVGTEPKVNLENGEGTENEAIAKALCFGFDRDEDATFTPDKENLTPNTLPMMSKARKGKAEEKKHSMSYRSSSPKVVSPSIGGEDMFASSNKENQTPKVLQGKKHPMSYRLSSSKAAVVSPSIGGEDMVASSDKENQTPKVLQERKSARSSSTNRVRLDQGMANMKRRAERVPFQSLLLNSAAKSKSEDSVSSTTARSSTSVNCGLAKRTNFYSNNAVGEGKRRWYMVVDTSSLLNRESRKALQLLQGLKGTQLIIPRMVVRELDCMKRRASLFRRMTEVSSVLQWIEECMASTNWWIHVPSSLEEGRPIASTPPASPGSRYSEGSGGIPSGTTNSLPFSACSSLMDVVSPTAEDHILEFALLYKRLENDRQVVLLSNDVSLKIKAMAEGLICETAEEFRESLVNPFSERFLWAESSPRGQTWSCLDDIVLRENYYSCPLKKAASRGGECVKGLKLILLHNSHYGQQIRTVS